MFGLAKKNYWVILNGLAYAYNHTKCVLLSNQNFGFNLLLLIYILTNTVKNYIIIHLQLN